MENTEDHDFIRNDRAHLIDQNIRQPAHHLFPRPSRNSTTARERKITQGVRRFAYRRTDTDSRVRIMLTDINLDRRELSPGA